MSYQPKFTITPLLLARVENIAALREQIQGAAVQVPWIPALQKDTRARNTHSSTAIEGNPLTLEEVRALEEGAIVAAPERARREVLNYFAALRHVEKQAGRKKRLAHEDIFRLHAIIAGAETVRRDNPSLTLRHPEISPDKEQPWRVILTRSSDLPPGAKLFTDSFRGRTLVFQDQPLEQVLRDLTARGVVTVLLEGGGTILAQAFSADLVDEIVFYTAPLISGSGRSVVDAACFSGSSVPFDFVSAEMTGPDVKLRARRRN